MVAYLFVLLFVLRILWFIVVCWNCYLSGECSSGFVRDLGVFVGMLICVLFDFDSFVCLCLFGLRT